MFIRKLSYFTKFSIIKSFLVSKKAVGFKKAFSFPILIGRNVQCHFKNSEIKFENCSPTFAMVRICGKKVGCQNITPNRGYFLAKKGSKIIFKGSTAFAQGCSFIVEEDSTVVLGQNFYMNRNSTLWVKNNCIIGNDFLTGWNTYLRNFDGHKILDLQGNVINKEKDFVIGNKVWLCANANVIKGVKIAENSIIGYGALVTSDLLEPNCTYAGTPAKKVKSGTDWDL